MKKFVKKTKMEIDEKETGRFSWITDVCVINVVKFSYRYICNNDIWSIIIK